jgi:hypothetical protein
MTILHFTEVDGSKEYVILTDEELDDEHALEYAKPSYKLERRYEAELDKMHTLPTERELSYPGLG